MTDGGPRRIGVSIDLKPHAYNPAVSPELFEGVLARRMIAFLIDLTILAVPVLLITVFMMAATIARSAWRESCSSSSRRCTGR